MNQSTKKLVLSAAVAALYAALSFLSSVFGLTYGPIQLRLSEALCILPFLLPDTVAGLFAGCLLTNLLSAYGIPDLVFGSLATLLAATVTAKAKHRCLAPLPPVLINGIVIGALISWYEVGFGEGFGKLFLVNGAWVALGEAAACFVFGGLLLRLLPRSPFFCRMMSAGRSEKPEQTYPKKR